MFVRIQPIVATLGTYLIFTGLTLTIVPAPTGTVPPWIQSLSGQLSIVPLLALAAVWLGLKQLPYYDQLMAVGSDDRASYTAGVPVALVRFLSYCLTGVFAGTAGTDADRADRLGRPQCRGELHAAGDFRGGAWAASVWAAAGAACWRL